MSNKKGFFASYVPKTLQQLSQEEILKSQEKIAQHPEIRGLLKSKNLTELQEIEYKEQEIESEEEELKKKLEELKRIRQQLADEKKTKIPEIVKFRQYHRGQISFELEHENPNIIKLINKHNGAHTHRGTNYFYLEENYFKFREEVDTRFPDTKFTNFERVHQPFWVIEERDKNIAVFWNPTTNPDGYYKPLTNKDNERETLFRIPGATKGLKFYTVPLSEGWRLYSIHPEIETRLCRWASVELQEKVKEEFNRRLRVREIHTAEDSDYTVTFPGDEDFKPRAHQRVAFEFSELVDHKTLIAYGTGTGKTAIAIGEAIRVKAKRVLVIVPGSLRLNWANHIRNLTNEEPIILAGRTPTEFDVRHLLIKNPRFVIINYEILRTAFNTEDGKTYPWVSLLNLYLPEYVIVDESHYIGNPSSSQSKSVRLIDSPRKMALSGTPIKNRPGELWAVLNWLHPEQFPYYETFLRQYGFGRAISSYDAQQLRSLLETIMLKRSRQDISKNLPPVNRIVENYEMSPKAQKIYNKILDGIYEELSTFDPKGMGGEQRTFKHILPKLNAMIKVCAADKTRITAERATEISDSLEEEQWNGVLIFTHFQGTCYRIQQLLGHEAIGFVDRRDKGFHTVDMEERMRRVSEFQKNPKVKYLVATEGSAREGLDITRAGVVIFNDLFWNPSRHIQCEGRPFYRESDMHGGDSYYLQFQDSIEDWLTELQGIKQNTIDKIVEGKGVEDSITAQIIFRLRALWQKRMGS